MSTKTSHTTGSSPAKAVLHLAACASLLFGGLTPRTADAQLRYLEGHTEPIYAVSYTPNGKMLVTGSFDHTVKLWDRASGEVVRTIGDHTGMVLTLAVSRDGTQFATAGLDRKVNLYDMPLSEAIADLGTQAGAVQALALSTDGKWLVSGDRSATVRLWQTSDNSMVKEFKAGGPIKAVAVDTTGQVVFATDEQGTLYSWNVADGKLTGTLATAAAEQLLLNPDNRTVITAGKDGVVRVFTWPPTPIRSLEGNTAAVTAMELSYDRNLVAAGGADGKLRLYNYADGKLLHTIEVGQPITSLSVTRDRQFVAVGDKQGRIRVWKTADASLQGEIEAHATAINDLTYHPSATQVATAAADGTVKLWAMPFTVPFDTVSKDTDSKAGNLQRAVLSPNSAYWVVANDKKVQLVKTSDGAVEKNFDLEAPVTAVAISPNNAQLVVGGADNKVRIVNVGDGKVLHTLEGHTGPITAVTFTPNGQQVATAAADKKLKTWNVSDGMVVVELDSSAPATALTFLPDGNQLLTGTNQGAELWNLAEKKSVRKFETKTPTTAIALSRDAKRLAVAGQDKNVRTFQIDDAKLLVTLSGHAAPVVSASFSPDGNKLLTSSEDKTARWWDVVTGSQLQQWTKPIAVREALVAADARSAKLLASDGHVHTVAIQGLAQLPTQAAAVKAVSYNSNGTQLATAGEQQPVQLWTISNLADLKLERTYGEKGTFTDVAINFANSQIAASTGNDVVLWKLADAAEEARFKLPAATGALAYSLDNRRVAVGCQDNRARLLDIASQTVAEEFAQHTGPIQAISFSTDLKQIVTGSADQGVGVWSPCVVVARKSDGPIHALTNITSGSQVYVGGDKGQLLLWNTSNLTDVRAYEGAAKAITALARSSNNQLLVATEGNFLHVWNANGTPLTKLELPSPATAVAIDTDGKRIVVVGDDLVVRNFNLVSPGGVYELLPTQICRGHEGPVHALALSSDGSVLVSGGEDKHLLRWVAALPTPRSSVTAHTTHVYSLAFNKDGTRLASAGADKLVKLYTTADGKNYATCTGHDAEVYGVAFRPDTDELVTCSGDKTIRYWAASSGRQVRVVEDQITAGLYNLDISPDGGLLITGGLSKVWKLWKTGDETPLASGDGHQGHIYCVEFNPAGNRVATLGYGGQVIVWDTSGNQLFSETLPVKSGYSLAYSPDGKELAIATSDNRLLLIDIPKGAQ